MIIFLVPVRHPLNTNNLEKMYYFLKLTLTSILNQTLPDFKIIVICNKIPNIDIKSKHIDYHIVNFPPPCPDKRADISPQKGIEDKGAKLISGFFRALIYNPTYVFFVDSDDWININLVKFLLGSSYPVYFVNQGYFVDLLNKRVKKKYGMIRYCGSTWIYNPNILLDILNLKYPINEHSSKEEILNSCSKIGLEIFSAHHKQYWLFKKLKISFKAVPFPVTSWVIGTGENHSQTYGNSKGLPLTKKFCKNFGIPISMAANEKVSFSDYFYEKLTQLYSNFTWHKSILYQRYYFKKINSKRLRK